MTQRFHGILLLFLALGTSVSAPAQTARKTQNVIFVMTDGLRWQDVFRGADPALLSEAGGVSNVDDLKRLYWRGSPEARREALMPFLWQSIAGGGQIYGNRDLGADAYVTNGLNFSYPGYNETLSGFPDPRIRSNDNVPNPNVTVLEWLHRKPAYRGKVAAFGAWEVISSIVNGERGGFVANAGYAPFTAQPVTPALELLNRLKSDTRIWDDEPFDSFAFHTALEYLKLHKPRVLYLSLGETDDWAHEGKYDLYLRAAHRVDQYLKELWETVQSMEEYRGKTTLIFSADHGRGEAPVEWKSHGEKIPGSKYIWMGFLGPDTRALGERAHIAPVTQSQIAATLAALLGEDYVTDVASAGKPMHEVLPE
jgi:Type I phosphodiesterase / nucleotide pyrophosphatase